MNRRLFLSRSAAALAAGTALEGFAATPAATADKVVKTPEEWRKTLTAQQFQVLREEGTERAFSSPLDKEKRKGTFVCAGCELALFKSDTKYDSGTGWPSFWAPIPGAVATKVDYKLIYPRTEYHCRRCERASGTRLCRRPAADRPALLQQRYRAEIHSGVALRASASARVTSLTRAAPPSGPRRTW